jgi:hypothetical protein
MKEWFGPVIMEQLSKVLPKLSNGWYRLPDGTDILIGTEWIYSSTNSQPKPCEVYLETDTPLVLWKDYKYIRE